jgi:hypothetical protein
VQNKYRHETNLLGLQTVSTLRFSDYGQEKRVYFEVHLGVEFVASFVEAMQGVAFGLAYVSERTDYALTSEAD